MRGLLCVLFLTSSLCVPGTAQNSSNATPETTKHQKVVELLKLARVAETTERTVKANMSSIKKTLPFPPQAQDDFEREFLAALKIDDVIEVMVPIYEQDYTESEIDQLIALYKLPIAQTMLDRQPLVSQQIGDKTKEIGREIGRRIGEEIGKKLSRGDYGPWQMPGVPKSASADTNKTDAPK